MVKKPNVPTNAENLSTHNIAIIQIQHIFICQNGLIFICQNIVPKYMKIQTSIHPMLNILEYKRVVPVRALIVFEM